MLSWLWKESFHVLYLCVFKRCKSLYYSLSSFSTFHRNVFSSFFVFNILLHITFTSQFYFSLFPLHFFVFAFSPIITCSISASFILTFFYDSNLIETLVHLHAMSFLPIYSQESYFYPYSHISWPPVHLHPHPSYIYSFARDIHRKFLFSRKFNDFFLSCEYLTVEVNIYIFSIA